MKIERTQNLTNDQKKIIIRLWNAEYPAQLAYNSVKDFNDFLSKLGEPIHFLLFDEVENLKGWLASFTRNGEIWFSMIVDTSIQKKGFGTRLLNEVKKFEDEINGWAVADDKYLKNNGEKYLSPIEFYRKNNFEILTGEKLENEKISAIKIKWKK